MLRRLASLLLVAWALGFVGFAVFLPQPVEAGRSDGIIVLTGGEGRIARGLELLRAHQAPLMLVSGVDPDVKPKELAAEYRIEPALMRCCITLGYESVDTRSNAKEAADWVAKHHLAKVRLVTSDWHMRRAAWELHRTIPASVEMVEDAVATRPSLGVLLSEYSKFLARRLWQIGADGAGAADRKQKT